MRRRDFVALIGIAAAARRRPAFANASKKIPFVGVLWHAASAEEEDVYLSVMLKAFHDLGYVEGKNIVLEHRFPAENPERFRELARELVEAKPDVILAVTTLGAIELKKVTNTIPIVLVLGADPVGNGLVESLARPGGNVTGLSYMLSSEMNGKRLELLKEAVPKLSRVALLVDPTIQFRDRMIKDYQVAAEALGLSLWPAEITAANDIEPVFSKIVQDRADGLIWATGSLLFVLRERIGAAAIARKLPAIVAAAEQVPYGLLMSSGVDLPDFSVVEWPTPIKY